LTGKSVVIACAYGVLSQLPRQRCVTLCEACDMSEGPDRTIGRRDVIRALAGVAVAATASAAPLAPAAADSESNDEKRKARYRADSPHVQMFYRVNRYPAR
jgi:hypothetical protein